MYPSTKWPPFLAETDMQPNKPSLLPFFPGRRWRLSLPPSSDIQATTIKLHCSTADKQPSSPSPSPSFPPPTTNGIFPPPQLSIHSFLPPLFFRESTTPTAENCWLLVLLLSVWVAVFFGAGEVFWYQICFSASFYLKKVQYNILQRFQYRKIMC